MKKQLLFAAMCLAGVSAFALKDITPEKYHFNTATSFEYHNAVYGTSNIGAPVWATIDGDKNFDQGLVVLCGGVAFWGAGNNRPLPLEETVGGPRLVAGTGLVDLGGEVGQVLAISGHKSQIADRVKELYGCDVEFPLMTDGVGWFNINFFVDPNLVNKDGNKEDFYNIRCRITCNFFENEITDANSLVNAFLVGDQGNIPDVTDNAIYTDNFIKMNADQEPIDDDGEPSDDYYWDPTRWMVYEVNMFCPADDDDGTTYAPVRLKYDVKADPLQTATMLIKSIEFFTVDQAEAVNTGKPQISFITLEPQPAGIQTVAADAVATTPAYYNMQGMRVANPQGGIFIKVCGNEVTKEVIR